MYIFSHNDQWWFVSVREWENCVSVSISMCSAQKPVSFQQPPRCSDGTTPVKKCSLSGETRHWGFGWNVYNNTKFQVSVGGKKKKLQSANFAPFFSPSFFLMLHKNTQAFRLFLSKNIHFFLFRELGSWNSYHFHLAIFTRPAPSCIHGASSKHWIPVSNDITFPFPSCSYVTSHFLTGSIAFSDF